MGVAVPQQNFIYKNKSVGFWFADLCLEDGCQKK